MSAKEALRYPAPAATLWQIAASFTRVSSTAFGGGSTATMRREVVVRRGWLDEATFVEVLSLANVVPGPNLNNMAVLIGARVHGPAGAVVAFLSMLVPGLLGLFAVAAVLLKGSGFPLIDAALRGCAAGAVGLTLANAIEMTIPYRRNVVHLGFVALAAVFVSVLHVALGYTLLALIPLSYLVLRATRR
jgi:chromate transporter